MPGAEERRLAHAETAIAVNEEGRAAIQQDVLAMDDEHRDLRSVLRGEELLLHHIGGRIDRNFDLGPERLRGVGHTGLENLRRLA